MDGSHPRIVLASGSPRRRELLGLLGVPFTVEVSRFDEHGPGGDPAQRVRDNAAGKAREVAARVGVPPGGVVLGCDTEVVLDGATLGQPADESAAEAMLRALAGRTHRVISVVVVVGDGGEDARAEAVDVTMAPLGDDLIAWYLATGEWRGKAGGYAIQGHGAVLVERIAGDYSAVVGLPLAATARLLASAGLAPWQAR